MIRIRDNLFASIWQDQSSNNCNTFFINGSKKILIDPGHFHLFDNVRNGLSRIGISIESIDFVIITHGHPDHMEALRAFSETTAHIAMGSIEFDFIKNIAPHYGDTLEISEFEPHILLEQGEMQIGDMSFQIIETPGHSPGSICIYWPWAKTLFTGDVIFDQGIGRTDLPGGSGESLKKSIQRLANLDIEHLLPGHGNFISGKDQVQANFSDVEQTWFGYI